MSQSNDKDKNTVESPDDKSLKKIGKGIALSFAVLLGGYYADSKNWLPWNSDGYVSKNHIQVRPGKSKEEAPAIQPKVYKPQYYRPFNYVVKDAPSGLNLRTTPDATTDANKAGTIKNDSCVLVVGSITGEWAKVVLNSRDGAPQYFVSAAHLERRGKNQACSRP